MNIERRKVIIRNIAFSKDGLSEPNFAIVNLSLRLLVLILCYFMLLSNYFIRRLLVLIQEPYLFTVEIILKTYIIISLYAIIYLLTKVDKC